MKTTSPLPLCLIPLVDYLDRLSGRATLDQLSCRLHAASITLEDVRPWIKFEPDHYTRNLVAEGEWYSILVLCWRSGQRSPIHDHAHSTCAFKVLTGVCSETLYTFSPCGQVVPQETVNCEAGRIVATQDSDTHQVANLQPEGEDLVTLHIYSPPLRGMQRFSITNEPAPGSPVELALSTVDGGGI